MVWTPTALTLLGFSAGLISGGVAYGTWRKKPDQTAHVFAALMLILTIWSLCYGFQLGFTSLVEQLRIQRMTLGVAGLVPTALFLFILTYAGYIEQLTRTRLALLLVDPITFLLLAVSNPIHELVWTPSGFVETPVGPVAALDFGPAYTIHITYAYLTIAAGIVLMVYVGLTNAPMYRKQMGLLVIGACPPFASHIMFTLGRSPIPHLDLTPFFFAFTGVLSGLALFKYDLLNRQPIGWQRALETTDDGLLITDEHGTIVDIDDIAATAFESAIMVGDSIEEVFPSGDPAAIDGKIHTVQSTGKKRVYYLQMSVIRDHLERVRGHVILFREVTDLQAYEQRLEVSNRVLRHNLRNDMTIISGYATALESALKDEQLASDAGVIRETAADLIDLSEKIRELTIVNGHKPASPQSIELVATTEKIISEFRPQYPNAQFILEAPTEATVMLPRVQSLRIALRNLVENAIEHNDSVLPRVRIQICESDREIHIHISDNGRGLPEMERRVFRAGIERPLQHSQGIGLWLVYLYVTELGGEIIFSNDDIGTKITVTLPHLDSK